MRGFVYLGLAILTLGATLGVLMAFKTTLDQFYAIGGLGVALAITLALKAILEALKAEYGERNH